LVLVRDELRERGSNAELVDIARVDASEQWLGELGERFAAEPSANERAEGLVFDRAARHGEVERHPYLAAPGEERRL
jgi:hypothetical protein